MNLKQDYFNVDLLDASSLDQIKITKNLLEFCLMQG